MKNTLKIIGLSILASVLITEQSYAIQVNGTASVDVVQPLTISETQSMNFGTVSIPVSGTATVIMNSSGAITGGTADVLASSTQAGKLTIHGDQNSTISLSVADDTGDGVPGLSLGNFTGSGGLNLSAGATHVSIPSGTLLLNIGATLTINSATATTGAKTIGYIVTADYE